MTKIVCALLSAIFIFSIVNPAHAGFGITPPYVKNDSLTRDSIYEQKIILTRNDPLEDLRAEVTVNVPGANEWISVDRGLSFTLPKGETQVPIVVTVSVPHKAKFGAYNGNIRVVLAPAEGPTRGTVGIALGAQIDVALTVADKKIYDFRVRRVQIQDAEEGRKFFGFLFPGKVNFVMQIENVGNIDFGPTKVAMDIKDSTGKQVESITNLGKIKKVKPFEIKDVVASLPTRLSPGTYKAAFKIFKGQEVAQAGELDLSIFPKGTIKGYEGFGFSGLKTGEQIIIILIVLVLIVFIALIFWAVFRHRSRRR